MLQEKVFCKNSLEAKLEELKYQNSELESRVFELEKILQNEQADVERLERTSLASVFYSMLGKKDDMLSKEKSEAYAAKLKYDSAVSNLNLVNEDISRIEAQLRDISECEYEYEKILHEKIDAIKASDSPEAEHIFRLEEKIAGQKSQKKEIDEAISAGLNALGTANSVLESLDSAEGWGTLDLIGGGLFSDIAKHSHLDEAQNKVEQLQNELRRFKTELSDVTIQADMQISVDGFLRFADYFFDNLFTDWAVMDKINQSQSSVQDTKRQIQSLLSRLNNMEADVEQQISQLEAEKSSVIASAAI